MPAVPPVPKDTRIPARWLDAAFAARPDSTATDVAAALDVDVTTISRWRRGQLPLGRGRWVSVLAVLGLPLDWRPTAGWKPSTSRARGRPRSS